MNSAVAYVPRPKKPTWPKEAYPAKPPIRFHAVASATNMNTVPMTRSCALYSWVCRPIPASALAARNALRPDREDQHQDRERHRVDQRAGEQLSAPARDQAEQQPPVERAPHVAQPAEHRRDETEQGEPAGVGG